MAVLVLLIVRLDDMVRALRRAEEEADWSRAEYERALRDYRTLARHRLANPLSAVRGAAETLAERGEKLRPDTRAELVEVLRSELRRLETTVLEPAPAGPEEAGLAPEPRPQPGLDPLSDG